MTAALEAADLNAKNAEECSLLAEKKIQAEVALAELARLRAQTERAATHAANRRLANERETSAAAQARVRADAEADEAMRERIAAEEAMSAFTAEAPAASTGRALTVTRPPQSRGKSSAVPGALRVFFVVAALLIGVSIGYSLKMPEEGAAKGQTSPTVARQAIREAVPTAATALPPASESEEALILRLDFQLRTTSKDALEVRQKD